MYIFIVAIMIPSNLVVEGKMPSTLFIVHRNFQVKFSSPCQKTVVLPIKAELEASVMVP